MTRLSVPVIGTTVMETPYVNEGELGDEREHSWVKRTICFFRFPTDWWSEVSCKGMLSTLHRMQAFG